MIDAREFITTELSQTLVANEVYRLSFYLSLADSMDFAVSKMGAYFSPTQTRGLPKADYFNFDPQVVYDSASLSDKENWTLISGEFVAVGGEKFLTIGSFWRDNEMSIEQVSNIDNGITSIYYLDDVSLEDLGTVGIDDEPPLSTFNLYPNPVKKDGWITVEYDVTNVNGTNVEFIVFDGQGRRVKVMKLPFLSTRIDLSKDGFGSGAFLYQLVVDGKPVHSGTIILP